MTTRSEWKAASRALMAEDRQRFGEPPTAEEVMALTRGELPAEEAARVRERLVAYPDLVRTLTVPFPTEGARPGDQDYMSDDEFATHWAALQKRRQRPSGGRVLQFWQAFGAIAAALAVVFGALFWQAKSELTKPRAVWEQEIYPDGRRGGGEASTELAADVESFLLVTGDSAFEKYRVEIVDVAANPPQTLWRSDSVTRRADGALAIVVHRKLFKPGKYQLVLYGVSGARQEPLSTYTIRVSAR